MQLLWLLIRVNCEIDVSTADGESYRLTMREKWLSHALVRVPRTSDKKIIPKICASCRGACVLMKDKSFSLVKELKLYFQGSYSSVLVFQKPLLYKYEYDQLNRLRNMDAFTGLTGTSSEWLAVSTSDYKESITYDANGNIKTYLRNGYGTNLAMDNLSYAYNKATDLISNQEYLVNNRLRNVEDAVITSPAGYNDIKNGQVVDNYRYDAIGNLVSDNLEGLGDANKDGITWNVYGKIASIENIRDNVTTNRDFLRDVI